MKKIIILSLMLVNVLSAAAWSQKGHYVTAAIAENHLSPEARAAVDSIFDGKSMVYWAAWLDNASYQMDYAYTKTWHYKNIEEGTKYSEAPLNPAGDVVTAINMQLGILSDPATTKAEKALALKILVHCMGDMHQPMHLGHASDRGGNKTKVKFFKNDTNLHSLWDSSLVEAARKWSYSEWADQIDRVSAVEEAAIVDGSVDDWAEQTYKIAERCYKLTPAGSKVMYDQIAFWTPVIEEQFLRGGLRLASLLNQIFVGDQTIIEEELLVPVE